MIVGGKYHLQNLKNAYNRKKAYRIKKARAITYRLWYLIYPPPAMRLNFDLGVFFCALDKIPGLFQNL